MSPTRQVLMTGLRLGVLKAGETLTRPICIGCVQRAADEPWKFDSSRTGLRSSPFALPCSVQTCQPPRDVVVDRIDVEPCRPYRARIVRKRDFDERSRGRISAVKYSVPVNDGAWFGD